MKIEEISKYKIKESTVLNDSDKKHIENYKQLINFFENAIQSSIVDGNANYNKIHTACLQSIRFLDSLIFTYDSSIRSVKLLNDTIDMIIDENVEEKTLGNDIEEKEKNQKNLEK